MRSFPIGFNRFQQVFVVSGLCSVVSGLWSLVAGLWSLVSGLWQRGLKHVFFQIKTISSGGLIKFLFWDQTKFVCICVHFLLVQWVSVCFCGLSSLVSGLWSLVTGPWSLVSGLWDQKNVFLPNITILFVFIDFRGADASFTLNQAGLGGVGG